MEGRTEHFVGLWSLRYNKLHGPGQPKHSLKGAANAAERQECTSTYLNSANSGRQFRSARQATPSLVGYNIDLHVSYLHKNNPSPVDHDMEVHLTWHHPEALPPTRRKMAPLLSPRMVSPSRGRQWHLHVQSPLWRCPSPVSPVRLKLF